MAAVTARLGTVAVLIVLGVSLTPPAVQAQDGRPDSASASEEEPDSSNARLLRADSLRAELVQPPGSYGGLRTMDVIRLPFQLMSATLTLGLGAAAGVAMAANNWIVEPGREVQQSLLSMGVESEVAWLATRSAPALLFRYPSSAPFFIEAGYSVRQYQHWGAGFQLGEALLGGRFSGAYRRLRSPHFWGVGPETRSGDRSDFAQDVLEVGGELWWAPEDVPLRLTVGSAWERNEVDRGWDDGRTDLQDRPFAGTLFGLQEPTEFFRAQVGLSLDRRQVRDLQVRGLLYQGEVAHYQGVGETESSYQRIRGDLRLYLPANERQLLAVRLLAEEHLGEEGGGVPFTHLAQLGDDDGLRGFSSRRFRDRAMLATQVEWRYQGWWHPALPDRGMEAFLFLDAGMVASSLDALDFSDPRLSPGFGLRWVEGGRGIVELFVALGDSRTRFDAALGRTF